MGDHDSAEDRLRAWLFARCKTHLEYVHVIRLLEQVLREAAGKREREATT